jgi:hypothetical protein
MAKGRPCKAAIRWFKREIAPADFAVLQAAGAGNTSDGWRELLAIYRHLWMLGWRPGMRPEHIRLERSDVTN